MPPEDKLRRVYRLRVTSFLVSVFLALPISVILYQGAATLLQLGAIERERDGWQKPAEVLAALTVKEGDTVADLGCGSGYFTLKLSSILGSPGRVLAVDIRRESLIFLWIRSLVLPAHNISIIHGQTNDPSLGTTRVDAVLIANTYHELTHPATILSRTYRSLRRGGRLVVIDRGSKLAGEARQLEMRHHEVSMSLAEEEIGNTGFEITSEQDHFIDRLNDSPWWLIVAVKP